MRGVVAIRRKLEPESEAALRQYLEPLIEHYDGINIRSRALSVSVIPKSQYAEDHLRYGPPTVELLDEVESSEYPIYDVAIDSLMLAGSVLAIKLRSRELMRERSKLEQVFHGYGIPILPNPHTRSKIYVPHCSFADPGRNMWGKLRRRGSIQTMGMLIGTAGKLTINLARPTAYDVASNQAQPALVGAR